MVGEPEGWAPATLLCYDYSLFCLCHNKHEGFEQQYLQLRPHSFGQTHWKSETQEAPVFSGFFWMEWE